MSTAAAWGPVSGMNTAIKTRLRRLGRSLAEVLVPDACAACDGTPASAGMSLCANCQTDLLKSVGGQRCATCGNRTGAHLLVEGRCTPCRSKPRVFRGFVCVGTYDGTLKRLVLRFKRVMVLDELLGGLMNGAIVGATDRLNVDCWVPIPSHWLRRARRGFQPTALLARKIARGGVGSVDHVLAAARYVPPFHYGMSLQEREEAIRGAFRLRRGHSVEGRRVALIDDVSTTGATLREARRVIRKGGAKEVFAVVAARVDRPAIRS